jgi:hypothetical protein
MSKTTKPSAAAPAGDLQASLPGADASAEQEAARLAAEQEAARLAAEQEAARLAAPVPVGMLRRDCIEGVWYPAGAVVSLPRHLIEPVERDGAIETAEVAVQYLINNGAPHFVHETPPVVDVQASGQD